MSDYTTSIGLDVHARSIKGCAFNPYTGEVERKTFAYDPAAVRRATRARPRASARPARTRPRAPRPAPRTQSTPRQQRAPQPLRHRRARQPQRQPSRSSHRQLPVVHAPPRPLAAPHGNHLVRGPADLHARPRRHLERACGGHGVHPDLPGPCVRRPVLVVRHGLRALEPHMPHHARSGKRPVPPRHPHAHVVRQ